jgi:hypothetical protein
MAFPSDVLLPLSAKYISFTDHNLSCNPNYDITWSFQFAITGNNPYQAGFSTFLTTELASYHYPGQYTMSPIALSSNTVNDENDITILTEYDQVLLIETDYTFPIISIGFDTTGLFALSSSLRVGLPLSSIIPNSLTIRGEDNKVLVHAALSSINTAFTIISSTPHWQTLRFRLANAGSKLSIDFKSNDNNSTFKLLTSFNIKDLSQSNIDLAKKLNVGFAYTSPVSSSTINPSTLFLKNLHIQGNANDPTYENIPMIPLSIREIINDFEQLPALTVIPL